MALETKRQTLEVETLIGAQYSQVLVRAETLVPGAGREAIEPLMAEANVSVSAGRGDDAAGADRTVDAEPCGGDRRGRAGHALAGAGAGGARGGQV